MSSAAANSGLISPRRIAKAEPKVGIQKFFNRDEVFSRYIDCYNRVKELLEEKGWEQTDAEFLTIYVA